MCNVYFKELKGWCKSFTWIEGFLSILVAIILVVFLGFLVFLILHFLSCRKYFDIGQQKVTPIPTGKLIKNKEIYVKPASTTTAATTLSPDVNCTWEPSQKTSAEKHYYLPDIKTQEEIRTKPFTSIISVYTTTGKPEIIGESLEPPLHYEDGDFLTDSDGEFAENTYTSQVAALVKLKPPETVTFGCILTKITKFWLLTAASCIESIEEVDSLDSFIIMEDFGEVQQSRPRTVSDVRMHPLYQGRNRTYDLVALRSDRALRGRDQLLRLPDMLDYLLVAIGEQFLVLGYGGYRTVDKSPTGRRLRQAAVYVVSGAHCGGAAPDEPWAPRHLLRGPAVRHAACGPAPLCAGPLRARGPPCNYCGGTPLLRGRTLLGLMSDNSACGAACEPQLYVNIAALRDWIGSVID